MDPHPDADGYLASGPRSASERDLRLRCGGHCGRCVSEDDEERIAFGAAFDPAMRGERGPQDPVMTLQDLGVVLWTELEREPGRAFDVREQKGDGPGREAWPLHVPGA